MKTYIIIASAIGNMGGGQMYVNNKVNYLRENGWEVAVFFPCATKNILLDNLKEFSDNNIPDMNFGLYYVPSFKRNQIVRFVKKKIDTHGELVIESQTLPLSIWGEYLAKRLGAKHIINCIEEQFANLNTSQYDFLLFKMRRWEILNFGVGTQKRLFKEKWDDSFLLYQNEVSYKCTNVTSEVEVDIKFAKSDYTILSIGRLSKPYVPGMVDSICNFAKKHSEKNINVVFVGGSTDGSVENFISKRFSCLSNVNAYLLGYLFPVPISIIKNSNVAIATANSILVTADQDVPTISLDINDYKAIGIYGYTTSNKFMRSVNEPVVEIEDLLEDVLINKLYMPNNQINNSMVDSDEEFERQVLFLEKSKYNTKQYFNVDKMASGVTHVLSVAKWYLLMALKSLHINFK